MTDIFNRYFMNNILIRIDDLRLRNGLSKAALAKKIDVAPLTISNWYKMDTMPSLIILDRICKIFGITIEQFFSDTELLSKNNLEDIFLYNWRLLNEKEKMVIDDILELMLRKKDKINDRCS